MKPIRWQTKNRGKLTLFWILLLLMINETRGGSEFIYFNF